jgi:hypothetical protein
LGAALLDPQHLLDLQPHAVPGFEQRGGMGADAKPRKPFARDRLGPLFGANGLVLVDRQDVGGGDRAQFAGHREFLQRP